MTPAIRLVCCLVVAICLAPVASSSAQRLTPSDRERIEGKMEQVQRLAPEWLAKGGDRKRLAPLQERVPRAMQQGDSRALEAALDAILAVVSQPGDKPMAAGLRLSIYDAGGNPVPRAELEARFFDFAVTTGVFPLDADYEPILFGVASVEDGVVTLAPELQGRVIFHFFPEVDGFGRVKVYADNGGKGYAVSQLPSVVDLPLEGARSRIAKVQALIDRFPKAAFRKETLRRLRSAKARLAKVDAGGASREKKIYRALADALWAGEMATIDAARHEIRKRGKRKDFLLGVAMPEREMGRWRHIDRYIGQNFDLVTVPEFFLAGYEKSRGKPRPQGAERAVDWAQSQGLVIKGHPLIYLIAPNIPGWLRGARFETVRDAMYRRIRREVGRFKGRVRYWDVMNETNNPNPLLDQDEITELTVGACRTLKQTDPSAIAIINVNLPLGDHLAARNVARMAAKGRLRTAYRYLRDLAAAGADCDVIGLQWYYWGLDIMEASRLIDRYASLGKPIHLSEVAFSSAAGVDPRSKYFQDAKALAALGAWHGRWTEETQADYLEQLYTVAYSKPAVQAVIWWDLTDDFWPYGGLVGRDGSPKKAYYRLESVRESWK